MNKLVSIITPCYNAQDYIADTIKSVQNQTYQDWEMLITDDGSTDNSVYIIEEIIKTDARIQLLKNKKLGPAKARNTSIEKATGKYMAFLDSDDLWFPHFLETSIYYCDKSEGFVCASYEMRNDAMQKVYDDLIVPKKANYNDILKTNTVSCLTAFIDIERLGKLVMPLVMYRQDMGLWIQYLQKINFVNGIQEPLAIYRIREKSHSRNKKKLLQPQWYFYRKIANFSIVKSIYYMIIWAYYGVKKYYLKR